MKIIDNLKIEKNGRVEYINFWYGIDLNVISNHPIDGSKGFMIILFDSFISEKRNYKIKSVLEKAEKIDFDEFFEKLNNFYVMLFQCGEYREGLIKSIKEKFENNQIWIPPHGVCRGAINN